MQTLNRSLVLLSVCSATIIGSGLFLFRSTPAEDAAATVHALQQQLAQRDHLIAELRSSKEPSDPRVLHASGVAAEASPSPESEENPSAENLALQERILSSVQSLEKRFLQLEERLERAKRIEMTPQNREATRKGILMHYGRFRENLNKANEEVRLIASRLNVPEAVAKLSPAEAISDPRYQLYHSYFQARIDAQQAEMFVNGVMNEISRITVDEALSK